MTEVQNLETAKQRRQRQAKERQAAHDKLTIDEKIAKAQGQREKSRLIKRKAEHDAQTKG